MSSESTMRIVVGPDRQKVEGCVWKGAGRPAATRCGCFLPDL